MISNVLLKDERGSTLCLKGQDGLFLGDGFCDVGEMRGRNEMLRIDAICIMGCFFLAG